MWHGADLGDVHGRTGDSKTIGTLLRQSTHEEEIGEDEADNVHLEWIEFGVQLVNVGCSKFDGRRLPKLCLTIHGKAQKVGRTRSFVIPIPLRNSAQCASDMFREA